MFMTLSSQTYQECSNSENFFIRIPVNGWKLLETAAMAEVTGNGWSLLNMAENGWKWLEKVGLANNAWT